MAPPKPPIADRPAVVALLKRIRGEAITAEEQALLDAGRKPTPEARANAIPHAKIEAELAIGEAAWEERRLRLDADAARAAMDVPLSARSRAMLEAGLESARRTIANGQPFTTWGDFTQYSVEDDDEEGAES